MAGSRTLKLNILAETASLIRGLNDADKATRTAGDKIKAGFKVAAAAIAAAGAAAIAFGTKAIQAAEQAATANARIEQINQSMGLFGSSVGQVNERLIAYAEATARATGIDQNSIKATQAKLLTFRELAQSANQVGGEFDRATKAAIDLAAAGFGSAETNAVQLGKALQDPIKGLTALSRSGVTFTETEKERIRTLVESNQVGEAQRLILEAIEKQVGGTAEATANATDKIRVTFSLLTERVGLVLLPIFEKFAAVLIDKVVPFIERYLVPAVKRLADDVNTNLTPIISKLWELFQKNLLPILQVLANFIIRDLVPTIRDFFRPVIEIIIIGVEFLTKKVRENAEGFNTFLGIVNQVWQFLKTYVIPLFQTALVTAINLVFRQIGTLIDAFGKVFEIISKVARFLGFDLSFELNKATNSTNANTIATANAYREFQMYSKTVTQEVLPATTAFTAATNAVAIAQDKAIQSTEKLKKATEAKTKATKEAKQANDEYSESVLRREFVDAEVSARFAGGAGSVVGGGGFTTSLSALGEASRQNLAIGGLNLDALRDVGDAATNEFVDLLGQIRELGKVDFRVGDIRKAYDLFQNANIEFSGLTDFLGRPWFRGITEAEKQQFVQEVNIYVQGALGDPEGTARAIQNVIQDSGARAGNLTLVPTGLGIE